MTLTIADLKRDHFEELSQSFGEKRIRYQLLAPLFENLHENKVIYNARFICLCQLSDVLISREGISALVHRLSVIKPFRKFAIPESWHIQAKWSYMFLSGDSLSAYSNWSLWLDRDFVQNVESLVNAGHLEDAISLTLE